MVDMSGKPVRQRGFAKLKESGPAPTVSLTWRVASAFIQNRPSSAMDQVTADKASSRYAQCCNARFRFGPDPDHWTRDGSVAVARWSVDV